MMEEGRFLGRSVESLQYMLQRLSAEDPRLQPVIPDGIYGQSTANAVSAFQRCHGLPVTGAADQRTWEAVVRDFEPLSREHPRTAKPGEKNGAVEIAQIMLRRCRAKLGGIPEAEITGSMDGPTVAAIRRCQSLFDQPVTGELDPVTWRNLQALYDLAMGCADQKQPQ